MPIYDFKCIKCKKEFERIVKNDKEIIFCDCGCTAEIVFNPTSSFHLKGTCWSKDNYANRKKTIVD